VNAMHAARATHDGHVCGGAQDVYRRLTASAALGGLLRVRLSPELRVARAYGPLAADERCQSPRGNTLIASLQLVVACAIGVIQA